MNEHKELSYWERWGLMAAIFAAVYTRLQRWFGLRIHGIYSRPLSLPVGPAPEAAGFSFRLFKAGDAEELIACSRLPELDIPEKFARDALLKGDLCDAILCDGSIVSYSWVALNETHDDSGVFVGVGDGYAYSYKALTLPEYRGRHLLRLSTARRDRYLIEALHCTRLIAFIALSNRSSMRLMHGQGYRRVGIAGYFKYGPLFWSFRSGGAKSHGFRFFLPAR